MDLVYDVLVALHLLGMAAIVGAWFALRTGSTHLPASLVWGARLQLLTGLILVGLREMDDMEVNNAKIGVKLVLSIFVVVAAEIANRRGKQGGDVRRWTDLAGLGAVAAALVAALW